MWAVAAFGGVAPAHAAPTVTTTITEGSSEPHTPDYPCLPAGGTLSDTTRNVLHVTDFNNGVYHYAGSFQGTATFVTAEGVVYTGRVASHFQINSNTAPNQFTVSIALRYVLRDADGAGSSFTGTVHDSATPTGREVSFELNHCPT